MNETFITLGESTLRVPAGSADPTLTLADGAVFNVPGQYRLRLDDSLQQPGGIATRLELCRATFNAGNVVNAFRSGADLEGSTAQAWPAGTKVVAVVTAAALVAALAAYTPTNNYKARQYRGAGGTQSVPNAIATLVTMPTIDYNPNASIVAGVFSAPVAAYYSIDAAVQMAGPPAAAAPQLYCRIAVNNAFPASVVGGGAGAPITSSYPIVTTAEKLYVPAGQTVTLWVFQSSGAVWAVWAASLAIHYLSS